MADKDIQDDATTPNSVATHAKTIGVIHPPPDIRNIVDTTASFVSQNGPDFEQRILKHKNTIPTLNFLKPSHPYHAYYQHRLSEFRSQISTSQQASQAAHTSATASLTHPTANNINTEDPLAPFRPFRKPLEPPEAEHYTLRLPEEITGEELDIIKLTAQFVARNGKVFLDELTRREMNSPHFRFLKPTYSIHFMVFTSLADAYSKVLMPPKGLTLEDKLKNNVSSITTILDCCLHRLQWERSQEQARQEAEDEIEKEKLQIAMIDWHDFNVVESIDFADDEDDDLPTPMTLDEVIMRSKMSCFEVEEIIEPWKEVEMEMDEEEVQLVEEGMRVASLEENGGNKQREAKVTPEEQEPPMKIVKNWKRPEERILAERDPTSYVVSPITGELILINEMSEHMRISLIDPKYKEQKERMFAKIRETTLAPDDEISRNIVGLARTRPDIFGSTEEEVSNAVNAEIEKKKDEQPKQVIWDGHTGSLGRTVTQALSQNPNGEDLNNAANSEMNLPGPAAPPARPCMPSIRPPPGLALNLPRMHPNIPNTVQYSIPTMGPSPPPMQMNYGQQTLMVHPPPSMPPSLSLNPPSIRVPPPPGSHFSPLTYVPHLVPQVMHMVQLPPIPQGIPPPPLPEEAPPLPEEPEPKRQKLDDSFLVPEDQFLVQHQGPACITVSVPNVDEGNLKGQLLEITVQSLSETVGSLKEKIAGEIQLPSNKQKLSGKVGFLRENFSLAYYNVGAGDTLSLSLRERGGRKR